MRSAVLHSRERVDQHRVHEHLRRYAICCTRSRLFATHAVGPEHVQPPLLLESPLAQLRNRVVVCSITLHSCSLDGWLQVREVGVVKVKPVQVFCACRESVSYHWLHVTGSPSCTNSIGTTRLPPMPLTGPMPVMCDRASLACLWRFQLAQ